MLLTLRVLTPKINFKKIIFELCCFDKFSFLSLNFFEGYCQRNINASTENDFDALDKMPSKLQTTSIHLIDLSFLRF